MENEVFLWCTIISGIFGIIMLMILQVTWRSKELFKIRISNTKKINDLEFKKQAKAMGLDFPKTPHQTTGNIGDLLGGLGKNLSPESIGAIADILQGRASGEEGEGSIIPEGLEGLVDFAVKNPDIVKGFMDGITNKSGGGAAGNELL
jgi:hypothetical protein